MNYIITVVNSILFGARPNQALPANPVKNTGRRKREYSGAGKLMQWLAKKMAGKPSVKQLLITVIKL
jgi:hypothetical protein